MSTRIPRHHAVTPPCVVESWRSARRDASDDENSRARGVCNYEVGSSGCEGAVDIRESGLDAHIVSQSWTTGEIQIQPITIAGYRVCRLLGGMKRGVTI